MRAFEAVKFGLFRLAQGEGLRIVPFKLLHSRIIGDEQDFRPSPALGRTCLELSRHKLFEENGIKRKTAAILIEEITAHRIACRLIGLKTANEAQALVACPYGFTSQRRTDIGGVPVPGGQGPRRAPIGHVGSKLRDA
ncbi:hypothetical protein FHX15_004677 [Rhizobium sp. BK650]|uniref:hypothetical protein n=1 Tax=Rhizobium sp. BK650 TaxID=2586990 RepID=UPI00161990CE|nr:hypothetical protein [Rhizobium sp. BK650]MBB3659413.1 hypothetical protein [Rhizobium sp. BK650]